MIKTGYKTVYIFYHTPNVHRKKSFRHIWVKMYFFKKLQRNVNTGDFCVMICGVISIFIFNYLIFSMFSGKVIVFLYQAKFNFKIYTHTHKSTHILKIKWYWCYSQMISKFIKVNLIYWKKSRNSKANIFLLDSSSLIYNFINMMKHYFPSPGECEIDLSLLDEWPLPGVRASDTMGTKCQHTLTPPLIFPEIQCEREEMDLSNKEKWVTISHHSRQNHTYQRKRGTLDLG